jgi:FSR family fosmidomycin resistance protein-like MFS transporter
MEKPMMSPLDQVSQSCVVEPAFVVPPKAARTHARYTLAVAGLAHATHDGYTDMIYALLPVWQAEFALGYAALALLRGLYAGAMAALQIPAVRVAERFGGRLVLVLGTILAAVGYGLAGLSGGILGLCAALTLSGAGSSVQHPIASSAVSRAYGAGSRGPLGTYNFAGDLGKATIPALASLLLTLMSWRMALWLIASIGLATAGAIALFMPPINGPRG